MDIAALEEIYITLPQIVEDLNDPDVDLKTVHNFVNYFRYMTKEYVLGKPVVKREDYEKFKAERPDRKSAGHAKAATAA